MSHDTWYFTIRYCEVFLHKFSILKEACLHCCGKRKDKMLWGAFSDQIDLSFFCPYDRLEGIAAYRWKKKKKKERKERFWLLWNYLFENNSNFCIWNWCIDVLFGLTFFLKHEMNLKIIDDAFNKNKKKKKSRLTELFVA